MTVLWTPDAGPLEPSLRRQHLRRARLRRVLTEAEVQGASPTIKHLAQALGVPQNRIGYAGLKDARATTCQVLSVEGVSPDRVMALDLPGIEELLIDCHSRPCGLLSEAWGKAKEKPDNQKKCPE